MASKCRFNYHEESEALVNKQINLELNAYYQYLAMVAFYDRDDVALNGFSKMFKKIAEEEYEHAHKLIQYQNLRGGRVVFSEVSCPAEQEWSSPLVAIEYALTLEKKVNQSLLDLYKTGSKHNDPHLCDYLEENFLPEQVEFINKLAKHHTNLVRVGDGLGVFLYDKELLS
ncbi:Ferritin [Daphnia magna]|uniref:Ferritin n=1 Tax=Daphnia magna TaxID=35525 RepID=A0A164PW54_9CRUS|nr:Ferritin [Daphnia magna]